MTDSYERALILTDGGSNGKTKATKMTLRIESRGGYEDAKTRRSRERRGNEEMRRDKRHKSDERRKKGDRMQKRRQETERTKRTEQTTDYRIQETTNGEVTSSDLDEASTGWAMRRPDAECLRNECGSPLEERNWL